MLLFSTVLDIKESFTADDLIRLVLEWNETSKYAENRVLGIEWHGEGGCPEGHPGHVGVGYSYTCIKCGGG